MSEGRSLIFPQAIALGARPLSVPGRGAMLAVSAFHAFRLSDGAHVRPATWYETVADHAGPETIPDSLSPLPGAELLVLGPAASLADATRTVSVRCGSLMQRVTLHRNPEAPDAPLLPNADAAAWHKEDNPAGRGGPDDDRRTLVVRDNDPEQPIWFGPTAFDHPLRLKLVGKPDAASGTGWPADADPAVLHEAHPAFWWESFFPGEPLVLEGFGAEPVDTRLPDYRISIVSGHEEDGRFLDQRARIHTVTLIPGADVGAVFWRAAIGLGDDILGESVVALVAALEDADSPVKDPEHWGRIAVDRWVEPEKALDDRPLLPAALAATVTLPFGMAADDPMKERHAAAEAWMRNEIGAGDGNPFGDNTPEEVALADQAIEQSEDDETPPDPDEMGDIATAALAAGRKRHEEAGFKERTPEEDRRPERRDDRLEGEMEERLGGPYRSARDRALAKATGEREVEGMDAEEVLGKLAEARLISPEPALPWPALEEDEALRFGDALHARLRDADPTPHIDVSGAAVSGEPAERRIAGRCFDGLFAEETVWTGTVFTGCEFMDSSFCRARFKGCEFHDCNLRNTNLSSAEFADCSFENCTFSALRIEEPTWSECRFERCGLEDVSMNDVAMSDNVFDGGSWSEVTMTDGLLMDVVFRRLEMQQVTFAEVFAAQNRFERIAMHKVWSMGKGFAGCAFEEVEADTCGFLSHARFDGSTFSRVRFAMTGFTNAIFADAKFGPDCRLDSCDLSGATFANALIEGVGFAQCSMTGSKWSNVKASNASFFGALLRGVDFADTQLANAVFADADLEGTRFQPDKTIGADFRGSVKAGQ